MRALKRPGCAAALLAVALVIGGFWAWRWWRAPGHGGLIVISGYLPPTYVLEGGVSVGVARNHPDCMAFKVQNPVPAYAGVSGEFRRLGHDRYRMVMDLRESPLGGSCGWRINAISVRLRARNGFWHGTFPLILTPPAWREPNDQRPWWKQGPMKVHCTRSGDELRCPDAINAIHGVEPEGHYQLDIEVVDTPRLPKEPPPDAGAGEQQGDP